MIDDEKQSFIDSYRDALERQRDLSFQNLDVARKNAFTNIMSGANKIGMMYSNFPERSKIEYDTSTYMPARVKTQQTYQTGLDSLRNNVTTYLNELAEINEATADLNKKANMPNSAVVMNEAGDYAYPDLSGGTQFRNANNEAISFGRALGNANVSGDEDILLWGQNYLNENDYAQLKRIWDAQQNTSHPNFVYNYGDNYQEPGYSWLSPEDNAFLGRLGLSFGF